MNLLKLFYLSIVLISLSSCRLNNDFSLFFNTDGLKTNTSELSKLGYERVWGVDVIMFEKKIKDTVINLYVDERIHLVSSKTWIIKLKSNDENFVRRFILDRNVNSVAPIAYYKESKAYYFTAIDLNNNMFFCQVLEEEGGYFLHVTYHVPTH